PLAMDHSCGMVRPVEEVSRGTRPANAGSGLWAGAGCPHSVARARRCGGNERPGALLACGWLSSTFGEVGAGCAQGLFVMAPKNEAELLALVREAMSLPGTARRDFVRSRCNGDDALRRRAEGLLMQEESATLVDGPLPAEPPVRVEI